MPVIPAQGRLRHKFEASLDYISRPLHTLRTVEIIYVKGLVYAWHIISKNKWLF
jgi:hypothetical protein